MLDNYAADADHNVCLPNYQLFEKYVINASDYNAMESYIGLF